MITMCDYYGMCDENGRCVGHPVKVTMEYGQMLKSLGEELRLVCSPCIAKDVEGSLFVEIVRLPYDISIVGNSFFKRITDKFKLFKNIKLALKSTGTIFFYQVDFFFFLYLHMFYHKSPDRKIVILIYHQDFTGGRFAGCLKKIYEKALCKIDGVIYTQKGAVVPHSNAAWMPDFIYRADEYEKYQKTFKINRVVCLGTMNRYKQIEELIEVWRGLVKDNDQGEITRDNEPGDDDYRFIPELVIAGRFDTKERYETIMKDIPKNVTVRNELLSFEEYMNLLSGSMYSILPYDMEQYKNRTSGVLLESIYCGTIPIAPKGLLEQNKLPGLGYNELSELGELPETAEENLSQEFDKVYKEYGTDYATGIMHKMLIGNMA